MNWWKEFASRIECDAPIGSQTWFRLGGSARCLFRPRSADDLALLMTRAAREHSVPRILGRGANVLIRDDGVDGVVIRLEHEEFRKVERRGAMLEVCAGVDLMPLVRKCNQWGLAGLECMAGIPGTVGGAVKMNAGGRFGEMGDVVKEVRVLDATGKIEVWSRDRIGFGYRRTELGGRVVLSALLDLTEDAPSRVKGRYDEWFEYKKRSQPLAENSAGCIFKNPEGSSAGALIDRAGLKGTRCGSAVVSHKHANFIVTQRGATASDVLRLIDLVRERVQARLGTELEVEIEIW